MNRCYEYGFNIVNDIDGRLRRTVEFVADYSKQKANILAGYVNSQEFLDYCKQSEKFDASKSLAENNQQTVRSLLRRYYRSKHKSALESAAKEQADSLEGFSSASAKALAYEHTANMINRTYEDLKNKAEELERKFDRKQVIRRTINLMEEEYLDKLVLPLYSTLSENQVYNRSKELTDKFRDLYNEVQDILDEIELANEEQLEELEKRYETANTQMFATAHLLFTEFGNTKQKNYSNMIYQMRANPNRWFTKAFESSKLVSIVNEFTKVLESDKLVAENFEDDLDYINPESENIDEMSKSWESKLWGSFDKAVAADLKLYFNSLYRLSAKCELGNENYSYDTDNELGVPTTMGANFVISQLINYGNYNSVNDFIDSIINMSQQVPELYGLIAIANKAVKDSVFANKLFTNLANPKIVKTMAILTEAGVDFTQSNKSADVLSYVTYTMINHTKSTMTSLFDLNDVETVNNLKQRISKLSNDALSRGVVNIEDTVYDILKKYYPKLSIIALKSYIYSNPNKVKENVNELLNNIISLLNNVENTITEYNEITVQYKKDYKKWAEDKAFSAEVGVPFNQAPPVRDLSKVKFERLNFPIINIAKKLVNYSAVKNELNSVNAEGNLSSDIIPNSWITNTLKQIAYGSKEDSDAGLRRLLEEVTKGEQYRYTSLFWGVKDRNGKILSDGLFIRNNDDSVRINPKARQIIQVSLFNGIKDNEDGNAVMYNRMSKGDYFLTNLIAFHSPVATGEHIGSSTEELKKNFAGYFMRTPSDAPKNFIVQAPKLEGLRIISTVVKSEQDYINKIKNRFNSYSNIEGQSEEVKNSRTDWYEDNVILTSNINNKNKWNATDIYDILSGTTDNINYNGMTYIENEDGTISIPILYKSDELIWVTGKKVQGETNNILYDIKVDGLNTQTGKLSDDFYGEVIDLIKDEGISNGEIETKVNKSIPIFSAIRQNLLNELNTFVDQLNNVFERNEKGEWHIKKNITGLIDRAHYNGNSLIIYNEDAKRYELSGNLFTFKKLFNTEDVDVNQLLDSMLSLYGEGNTSLLQMSKSDSTINISNGLVIEREGRLVLSLNNNVQDILDNITEQWINAFSKEVVRRTQQYKKLTNERFSREHILDCMLNTANAEMAFDDVFEGDVKFYKNAQDFLKRAKEVQASGSAYAGFDINDKLSEDIKEVLDRNGNPIKIMIGDVSIADFLNAYSPVEGTQSTNTTSEFARNGWKAVTIYNTIRPSKYANRIRQEVIDILKEKMDEAQAIKIAERIYQGYASSTKTNDAQSYITLEEFIRRRWADGTLDEYKDLLTQIYEVRTGKRSIKNLDLAKINARIQVQKNFYFDKHFDTATRTHYPRQIKNAEFVLIPELLEGTDLKGLYDIMVKHDIGQINTYETSKAANKNVLTYWNHDGSINKNFETDLLSNNQSAVEDFYYRYLYKQQEVPEHMKDEQNKAGIQIMKKIIDNADDSVSGHIKKFFDNYCANIKDDFNRLIFNMGWKVNEDGSLSNINGDTNASLNFTSFYERARHEAQRLGLDENFVDYITPDHLGNPLMPNYMNNVSSKLESIAQAIFNSAITRQTLPGWHAAQVTQIGHGTKVLDSNGKLRELKYHPEVVDKDGKVKQEAYAEVLIPRWSNLIPKDYPIEKLEKEGLDIQIAYRIPTEGKQSVSVVKVVGFLDDVYGSTILLPDEWVTQTGADFDVDSVYAIRHEIFKDKKGNIRKITFDNDTSSKAEERRYISYVNRSIEEKTDRDIIEDEFIDDEIQLLKNELKELNDAAKNNKAFEEAMAIESEIYERLPEKDQEDVKAINAKYKGNANILTRYEKIALYFSNKMVNEKDEELKKLYNEFSEANETIADIIDSTRETKEENYQEYKEKVKSRITEIYEENRKNYLSKLQKLAKKAGLLSLQKFRQLDIIDQNSRRARNNNILDAMIAIMESSNSREENYSRSNFDDITYAMKEMNDARGASKVSRSTYNLLDQIDFMENAMSGASLKAFSVTRDTFNSVNNYVKSELGQGHEIVVDYDLTDGTYDANTIISAYGLISNDNKTGDAFALDKDGKLTDDLKKAVKIRVRHRRLANSNNNRNVVGQLLTVYSSETTAHILDAIKEGAIYNENEYTFGTFKTLIDTGIDYRTAIAFLMQPAITTINEVKNESNSIYSNMKANPVKTAIKRIANNAGLKLGGKPIEDYSDYNTVLLLINTDKRFQEAFKKLFGAEISDSKPLDGQSYRLNVTMLKKRLKGENLIEDNTIFNEENDIINAAFDIAMAVTFNKIHDTTSSLEKIMRCSNPDRFGAKQTVRATRMTINNISEFGFNPDNPLYHVIKVGNKSLIESLYPGYGTKEGININRSSYPYLAAFLKYSTIPSVQINSQLFPTESQTYNDITNAVQKKLGVIFTDEQYREYKQYMMTQVYNGIEYLMSPLTITEEGWFDLNEEVIEEYAKQGNKYWDKEVSRLFGYNETREFNVEIKDAYNPTKEELREFNKLTPLQKVLWVQTNMTDDMGVFKYINVNKFNQWEYKNKGYSQDNIRFTDSSDEIREVYFAFNYSFYNTNKILRLATLDLMKYAFIVEGFKFKKGGLSKIITNNAMYKNIEDMGTSIIPSIRRNFQFYSNPNAAVTEKFIDRFIRSHSEYVKTLKLDRPETKAGQYNLGAKFKEYKVKDGLIFIPFEKKAQELLQSINAVDVDSPQQYIRINEWISKKQRKTTLYKIDYAKEGIYLSPLNLLEKNENWDYSVNTNNNNYPDITYYKGLIDSISRLRNDSIETTEQNEVKLVKTDYLIPKFKFDSAKESIESPNEFKRILSKGSEKEKAFMSHFIKQVTDYVQSPVEVQGSYILVRSDSNYIFNQIPTGVGVIQHIPINGEDITVEIRKVKQPSKFALSIQKKEKLDVSSLPIEQRAAYENAYAGLAVKSNYYKVTRVTDESVRNKIEEQNKEREDAIAPDMAAITTDASDFYSTTVDNYDIVDETAKNMLYALKRAERQGDVNAARARQLLELKGLNEFRGEDIVNFRSSIYGAMANYLEIYSSILDNSLKHYKIGDDEFDIGNDALYTKLLEHPEAVEDIVKLLLEAITFGDTFGTIMTLPFEGLDENTTNHIRRIRKAIVSIRNNTSVKKGFDNMFNNYIANEFSTNPNVRMGLVNLNDTFGDAGWWESWIGDTAMISNKQIQNIVKIVNRIMTQAAMDDAPKRKREFLDRLDTILEKPGEFSWDNVIDSQGRLIRPYTAQFIEDRERLKAAVQEAKDTYGIDSIEYINAKLERDKWYAENVHQIANSDYYKRKNTLIENILKTAPKEYVEYMTIIHELYGERRDMRLLTKEERDRRRMLKNKIKQLTSEYIDDTTLKSDEARYRANELAKFIEKKRDLENEYFEYKEAYGFREALLNNLKIIERIDKANPKMPLNEKLLIEEYKDAYDWIKDNSYYTLDDDAKTAINNAFDILKDKDNNGSNEVKAILVKANAYDEYGNIDPTKLSDEDIAKIKALTKHKYDFSYDSNAGEAILIKDVPTGLPVFEDAFYRLFRDPSENEKEINPLRLKVIGRINELLGKVIGKDDTRIRAKDIFNKLTEEELSELAQCYRTLKSIKSKRKPKFIRERIAKNVEFKTNNEAFDEEYAWAMTNIKGTKDFDTFLDIFVQTDENGIYELDEDGHYVPNNDIYGYVLPKDDTYINKEKTNARQLIEENVEFVPTEYYYQAMEKASAEGKFDEWFTNNHVFNPYKHKFEPLRVWTTMQVNPNGSLKGKYSYVPTDENKEKTIKEGKNDNEYNPRTTNYNSSTGSYNNYGRLSSKETEVQQLLQETMDFFAKYNNSNPFIEQGYIPRKRKTDIDTAWYIKQALGTVGLEYRNDSDDKWSTKVDFTNDVHVDNDMLHLLKGKGYQKLEKIRAKGVFETPEEYKEYVNAVNERNKAIKEKNLAIDNALMDKDYRIVFAEAIEQQIINNAKNKAKNWLYLLQEDLKNNEAYKVSRLSGKLVSDSRRSVDTHEAYVTTKQNRALESVEAFTRRVIYDQFKEKTPLNKFADLARNITSAKYMIFNVTGGIANVGTGFVNIMGEAFAEDSFSKKDLREAVGMYLSNSVTMLSDMYKETSNNFAVALTKYFNVVDFDAMAERVAGETAGEYARRIRNIMYGLQSGGEHFMQNSVLFAVLKGNRIFDDIDGTKRCGTFQEYIWKTEYDTLLSIIGNNELLMDNLRELKKQIKSDKQLAHKYDTFKRNIVEDFLRAYCTKDMIKEYIKKRNIAIKNAKKEWATKKSAIDCLKLKDGYIEIDGTTEFTDEMKYDLRNKAIALNKKIHGVYDKIGAARIEFEWWGGLVMQYHKHIYPGMMKRFRTKGYYNEQTNTVEIGSYAALVRLLTKEFTGLSDRIKDKNNGEVNVITSVQETIKTALDCIININTNWNLMPQWERNAVKRCLGDLYGVVSAMLMSIAIYAMTDDDDEKESEFIATALYISDRLLSEAQMYTPWGLISEAKVLWSSPIAATNGPQDLLKGAAFLAQWMFDDEFNPTYQTGLYAGQNKGWVLLKRNIPLYRVIDRLSNMTKNNSYYRINQKALNMRITKAIADEINPD